jgi:hypothetical protein
MRNYAENSRKSDLYARVLLTPVNAIQRELAVNALRDAELVSNGIVWATNAVRRLFAHGDTGTPRLLHNH